MAKKKVAGNSSADKDAWLKNFILTRYEEGASFVASELREAVSPPWANGDKKTKVSASRMQRVTQSLQLAGQLKKETKLTADGVRVSWKVLGEGISGPEEVRELLG